MPDKRTRCNNCSVKDLDITADANFDRYNVTRESQ